MPGPISHLVYAEKLLPIIPAATDATAYYIGTSFPDIRSLGVIEREKTHPTGLRFEAVQQATDGFAAGMLLHAYIDEVREAFVRSRNAYAGLPDSYLSTVALKICEDERLYARSARWELYIRMFDTILPQETAFGIDASAVQTWHQLHQRFLALPPRKTIEQFLHGMQLAEADVAEIMRLLPIIDATNVLDTYLDEFYDRLEELVAA
jgi:hypothetical protein